MFPECFEMLPRAIALVLGETIRGKLGVDPLHKTIPCHLRNHARGRDGKRQPVALHQCLVRNRQTFHRQSIHQRDIRRFRKRTKGKRHRLVGGAQDIDFINFLRPDQGDRPYHIGVSGDFRVENLPPPLRQLLGIIEKWA